MSDNEVRPNDYMPFEERKRLTDSLTQKLLARLAEIGKSTLRCDMCSSTTWNVDFTRINVQNPRSGGMVLGGAALPVAALCCATCGNTKFVNLKALGVLVEQMDPKAIAEQTDRDLKKGG